MKNNKGITLIALVVTIIILLILAGVSITTLSGNGLFGRAESSAAKYQQASETENSTLSSLMDKYDQYENETKNMVTITWSGALAEIGSYINNLTPETTRTSNLYDKEIVLIKPDGTKQLLNPYQSSGSITVPAGTKYRLYCYNDTAMDNTWIGIFKGSGNVKVESSDKDGSLIYAEDTISASGTFDFEIDGINYEWGESGPTYVWAIRYIKEGESLGDKK